MNQSLYSALWLEKIAMGIGIGLIVMVAALNIVASLVLLVMEKTRDIAILKTMGASARSVMLIFLLQGMIIGVVGTLVGASAGAVIAWALDRYRLISIPSDVYRFRICRSASHHDPSRHRASVVSLDAVSVAPSRGWIGAGVANA
jgi:lipoprotein-releasing system permease protein